MSAPRTATRSGRQVLVDAGWRAALVVAGAVAVALEAPVWLRLPLSAVALAATAGLVLRSPRRGGVLHVVLLVAGGGLVALALLGLVLNLLPVGLGPIGWALGVGALELALLAAVVRRHPTARSAGARGAVRHRRLPVVGIVRGIGWGAAVAAVLVGAVVYSTASFEATHVEPLAITAEPDGDTMTLTVTAGSGQGPFDLDLVTAAGRSTVAAAVRVGPGDDYTTRIAVPDSRAVVQLVPTGSATPLRQLILDDASTAGTR